jgi:hypothetical protein
VPKKSDSRFDSAFFSTPNFFKSLTDLSVEIMKQPDRKSKETKLRDGLIEIN